MSVTQVYRTLVTYLTELFESWGNKPLKVKRIHHNAYLPSRGSVGSVGLDLRSVDKVTVNPGERKLVDTGLAFVLPAGTYGRLAPRSSLSCKGIDVKAGVIDPDYRGEVKVLLYNFGTEPFTFDEGTRIAQLILEKVTFANVEEILELDDTARGDGGFGSTGK